MLSVSIMTDTYLSATFYPESPWKTIPTLAIERPKALNCPDLSFAVLVYGRELDMYVITTVEENDTKKKRGEPHLYFSFAMKS